MVIDRGDMTRIVNVGKRVGGEENQIGGVAGGDEAHGDGGVECVEQFARGTGGDGDGFERGETGEDEILEFAVFAETRDAAWNGAGVGAEGYVHTGIVKGFEVL